MDVARGEYPQGWGDRCNPHGSGVKSPVRSAASTTRSPNNMKRGENVLFPRTTASSTQEADPFHGAPWGQNRCTHDFNGAGSGVSWAAEKCCPCAPVPRKTRMAGVGGSQDLRNRGVSEIDLIVTDGHDGLLAAVSSLFPATPWQRGLVHIQPSAAECHSQARAARGRYRTGRHLETGEQGKCLAQSSSKHSPNTRSAIGEAMRSLC
jgi:Transposase, Mutator family